MSKIKYTYFSLKATLSFLLEGTSIELNNKTRMPTSIIVILFWKYQSIQSEVLVRNKRYIIRGIKIGSRNKIMISFT